MFYHPAWALVAAHKLPEMLELCQQEVFTNQNVHTLNIIEIMASLNFFFAQLM